MDFSDAGDQANNVSQEQGLPRDAGTQSVHSGIGSPEPQPWNVQQPYMYYLGPSKSEPWSTLKTGVSKHDEEMCRGWKDDLDTMLVFTGLFSAILTAFSIESFNLLSQEPADTTNALLLVISQQIANSSSPQAGALDPFTPSRHDVQINVLYFISLTLALSVSFVCILAKQWIREYQKEYAASVCDAVRLRQARFDNLYHWKVPQILSALPVILQAALLLFFAGLLDQLWHVSDSTPAIAVSCIVASTVLLVLFTTVVPAHYHAKSIYRSITPFRSPQAWIYFACFQRIQRFFGNQIPLLRAWSDVDAKFLSEENKHSSFVNMTSIHKALRWTYKTFRNAPEMEKSVLLCLQEQHHPPDINIDAISLSLYLASGETARARRDVLDDVSYDITCQGGISSITHARGRFQVELLLRAANEAIDQLALHTHQPRDLWTTISRSCSTLYNQHGTFDRFWTDDPQKDKEQRVIHDQIALMLHRLFLAIAKAKRLPSLNFNWANVVCLLLRLANHSKSPLALRISLEIITESFQTVFKVHPSVSLLCIFADAVIANNHERYLGLQVFTALDKIMVQLCNRTTGVLGVNEENLRKWNVLRFYTIENYNERIDHTNPEDLALPYEYFATLHGPCPALDSIVLSTGERQLPWPYRNTGEDTRIRFVHDP